MLCQRSLKLAIEGIIIGAVALLQVIPVLAEDSDYGVEPLVIRSETDILDQLADIRGRVKTSSQELAGIRKEKAVLITEHERINKELSRLKEQREVLQAEISQHTQVMLDARAAVDQKQREFQTLLDEARRRLRALYMTQHGLRSEVIFSSFDTRHAVSSREILYLRRVLVADQDLLQGIETTEKGLREREGDLAKQLDALSGLEVDLSSRGEEIQARLRSREQLLVEFGAKESSIRAALAGMKKESGRLERLLRAFTGGDLSVVPSSAPIKPSPPISVQIPPHGEVIQPVRGTVIRPFGSHRVMEFSDYVASNGVEARGNKGELVYPILPGHVRFVGEMPGYGTVVVVDHGDRIFSLYGRLESFMVKVGQGVTTGDSLGMLGEVDAKGRNFYLETRVAGTPVDPISQLGVPWGA
jgi:septal ring factor EnvC (AmiA/AmiB activator)